MLKMQTEFLNAFTETVSVQSRTPSQNSWITQEKLWELCGPPPGLFLQEILDISQGLVHSHPIQMRVRNVPLPAPPHLFSLAAQIPSGLSSHLYFILKHKAQTLCDHWKSSKYQLNPSLK